jgi:urea carboxylase
VEVEEGVAVKQGDPLVIVESMKMEFAVLSPCDGHVYKIFCREGGQVSAGQDLLVLVSEPE